MQSSTKSGSTHVFQSHKSAQNTSEADQSWEFVQPPHIQPQMASQLDPLRVSGRKRKRHASSHRVGKREQSHQRDLEQHHKLTVGADQDASPKLTDIDTVAETVGKSEASAERDDGIASTSNKVIPRLEVVELSGISICSVYDHTKVILRQGKQYFSAMVDDPHFSFQATDLNIASLDITPIPSEHFCPKIKHNITEVLNVLPNTYIKRPRLTQWGLHGTNLTWHAEIVLQEAEVCEVLKRNPHPNIAQYYGCLVEAERIVGLCFVKYTSTLYERLIGSSLAEREAYMEGIERGVFHLHQLGLIHNDLNPANIMMDGDVPVIIDFDSCRRKGERLGFKKGTTNWDLSGAKFAGQENDFYSLAMIRQYFGVGTGWELEPEKSHTEPNPKVKRKIAHMRSHYKRRRTC